MSITVVSDGHGSLRQGTSRQWHPTSSRSSAILPPTATASTNGVSLERGKQLAAGHGTITRSGNAAPFPVERLTYHAMLAGLQALLAENYTGALTIAAAPAFIALLRQRDHPDDPGLQRLRRYAVQLLNRVRGELTLHEQLVVPPLMVEAPEPSRVPQSPSHRA